MTDRHSPDAATTLVCTRHGEIRPPMRMPVLVRDIWRCPYCGGALVLPSVAATLKALQGSYLCV